jgi:nucleotide-binding universal stress UspA family protein
MSAHEVSAAPIVVGLDGSTASKEALHWAARQAQLTGSSVRAVISWRWPDMYGYAAPPSDLDLEAEAREVLAKSVAEVLGDFPDVAVEQQVRQGHPSEHLLEESKKASLLVVGSRGHGAFAGMLLGSVSEHCVSHAACPVVVVRRAPEPAPA